MERHLVVDVTVSKTALLKRLGTACVHGVLLPLQLVDGVDMDKLHAFLHLFH